MVPKLTKSELERPRHACELYEWVRRIHKEFGKTSQGKNAVRLRSDPILKKFIEEVWPLANYAKLFFGDRSDVSFVPVIGDQPHHDAFLREDNSGKTLCYFQVTLASYNCQERLRDEHLCEHGRAPLTTKQPLLGGRSRPVEYVEYKEAEAVWDRDWVGEALSRIRGAIEKKDKRSKKNRGPGDTVLIVEFGDAMLRHAERHRERLEAGLKCSLWLASAFSELALIAESGDPDLGSHYLNPGRPAVWHAARRGG